MMRRGSAGGGWARTIGGCLLALGAVGCADDPTSGGGAPDAGERVRDRGAGEAPIAVADAEPGALDAGPVADAGPAPLDAAPGGPAADGAPPTPDAAAPGPRSDGGGPAPTADAGAAPRADAGGQAGVCGRATAEAERARRPVDIVWVIDSSPSMDDEIAIIQARLNDFALAIGDSGLDYRVALVAAEADLQTPGRDYFGVCIPPPLSGAPGCPDADSAVYRHVRAPVHSADALDVLLANAAELDGFLRPEARQHLVVVSDDDHRADRRLAELVEAGFGADLVVHSVVTLLDYVDGCGVFDPDEVCSCGDERGRAYIALSEATGGRVLDLCSDDWAPIFDALNTEVEAGAEIPCAFDIPEVNGAVIDPQRINVDFVAPDGAVTPLFNVDDCAADASGWRFDDPAEPTRVLLCPGACGAREGAVTVEFGCEIRKQP